ncbi:MAG: acyl-CoA thioesterase II [Pseudomonadota bacterium]
MSDPVQILLDLLDIERIEDNIFRGLGGGGETSRRIFGGQVVAQALAAAYQTVDARACHSLHAYFLRPGDPSIPVIYEVDRARDGGSFTTRRVVAIQHGHQIFNMAASFHIEEDSPHHQHDAPEVAPPEGLRDRSETRAAEIHKVPKARQSDYLRPSAIQQRVIDPYDLFDSTPASDQNAIWFRLARPVSRPAWVHQCLMTYASDMYLLGSSLRPHGESWFTGNTMTASLDHAIWFHAPVRFDEWHLYAMDAPFSGGARGFNRGSIYAQDGKLVATTAQEGLVRPIRKK